MRFKEFFVETPVADAPPPAYVAPAVPGKPAAASSLVPISAVLGPKTQRTLQKAFVVVDNETGSRKIVWGPKDATLNQVLASIDANPAILDKAHPDLSNTGVASNTSPQLLQAKTIAETYLGRPLANSEFDPLLRVAYAEGSHRSDEQAWIIAAILNSVRRFKNSVYHEISKVNRIESVTGREVDPTASPNFSKPLTTKGLSEVLSAFKILPSVPKDVMHFTAIDNKAYRPGTSTDWKHQLMTLHYGTLSKVNPPNIWGKIVGKSVFTSDFTPEIFRDIETKLVAKSYGSKTANTFAAKTAPAKPAPTTSPIKSAKTTPAKPAPTVAITKPISSTKVGKRS